MIKKVIKHIKYCIVFLCIVLYAVSSKAQDASAIHGSIVVVEGEARYDQGDLELSTSSISRGDVVGTSRKIPAYISFMGSAYWKGASYNSYIDGYVRSYKSDAFTFPIGDNGVYRPAATSSSSLTQPVNAAYYHVDPSIAMTSSIFGGMESALPTGSSFSTSIHQEAIKSIDPTGYWHIQGASASRISLSWVVSTAMAAFTSNDLQNLTIVGWKNNQWVEIASRVDATSILGTPSDYSSGSITTTSAIIPNDYAVLALGSKVLVTKKPGDTTVVVSNSDIITIGPVANIDPDIDFRLLGPYHGSGTATIDSKTGLITFTPVVPSFLGRDTIYKIRCVHTGSVIKCDTTRIIIEGRPARGTPVLDSTKYNTGKVLADLPPISTGGKPYTTSFSSSAGSSISVDANGKVTYTPRYGFTGQDTVRIIRCVDDVCDVVTYIIWVNSPDIVEIPNYISPNGDGINDVWDLDNLLSKYPNTKALIYNRWGNVVWRSTGPYGFSKSGKNVWYGQREGSQDNVPDGVYYYLLELENEFKTTKTGFIEVMRQ